MAGTETSGDDSTSPFISLGGEPAVRTLVDRFYDLMDLEPAYAALRAVHGSDLANARRVYLTLIQRHPQSRFVPNAYLSFAEFFFEGREFAEALGIRVAS